MTEEANFWISGTVWSKDRNGLVQWEIDIYKKRRFWFNKPVFHRMDTALSKADAMKAISAYVERTTGIKGYMP